MKTFLTCFGLCGLLATAWPAFAATAEESSLLPDSTIRIVKYVRPVFPLRLSRQGIASGEARVAFELNAAGHLVDLLRIAYTHREFADATVEAMQTWRFEPAKIDGKPVSTVGELTMRFETSGVLVVSKLSNAVESRNGEWVFQPCEPSRLDCTPALVEHVEPFYPKQYYVEGATGAVTLDFYIDERGRVRMPMVKGASAAFLAGVTVAAVKQWRFEPPLSRGKPVLVHVNQEFNFTPKSDG